MIKNKNKGFTLVEILMALVVLGIGMVGLLSVFTVGANSVRRIVEKTEASFIAQICIEDLKRQAQSDPGSVAVPTLPQQYIDGNYVINSFTNDGAGITNLREINFTVDRGAKTIAKFTTFLTKYEP